MKSIMQVLRNFFFSQEWFQDMSPYSYFAKVNGNWRKYITTNDWVNRKFCHGEKIEKVYNTHAGQMGTVCQNDKCQSLVTIGSRGFLWHKSNGPIWNYRCSCCGQKQCFISNFTPLLGKNRMGKQTMIPCDEEGKILKTA